jgi:alpha-1,6-mannosyltransferase
VRVVDINSFYSPRGGGVRTYHQRKIKYFLEHTGHDYTFVCADEDPGVEELSPHVRVIRLRGMRMSADYRFILDARAVRRVFRETDPDIVEIGEPYVLPWVTRAASVGRRIPTVGYWHADFPVTYVKRPVARLSPTLALACERVAWWYARRTYGQLNAVMASARTVQDRLTRKGFNCVYHTPLGVDTRLFHPDRRCAGLRLSVGGPTTVGADKPALLLFPHRLTEEKGLTVVLEAFTRILQSTDAVLVVAGAGPGKQRLRSCMERCSQIHYLGYVSDPDVLAGWYASADLLFALSPYETFGLTALEGMSSGCPVVAANGGALPELVNEAGCGLVVPHDDPDQVARAALLLLEDRQALKAAGHQARAYAVARHDWDVAFEHLVHCYGQVLGACRGDCITSPPKPVTEQ